MNIDISEVLEKFLSKTENILEIKEIENLM